MRAAAVIVAIAALLTGGPTASAQRPDAAPMEPADRALAAHCLSANPDRLALSAEQTARIEAILRAHPEDSPDRREAILKVLTRTQWMVFWRTAGIAAC